MEYHYISYPKEGESLSGDAVFVLHESQYTRFLIIDALGDGKNASPVISQIERNIKEIQGLPLVQTVNTIDAQLKDTCGANIAVVDFYPLKMQYCCLGDMGIKSNSKSIINVIGDQSVKTLEYETDSKDVFILHTKGISGDFSLEENILEKSADNLANFIMDKHRNRIDDSTVLVVKP